jgi:hypothetical protein
MPPDTHGSGPDPAISSYWINFVTTVPAGVVMPLVEGLKNEVVYKKDEIREPIRNDG